MRRSDHYKLKEVSAAILERHPILADLEANGIDWAKLQYVESEVLLGAMLTLKRDYGIPSLPLHDCLIVAKKDEDIARLVLSDAFEEKVGVAPVLS